MDMNLSKLQEVVKDRDAWHAAVHRVTKSWIWLSTWTTTKTFQNIFDEAVIIINCIKSLPLNKCFLNVLSDKALSVHEVLVLYPEVWWECQRAPVWLLELHTKPTFFSTIARQRTITKQTMSIPISVFSKQSFIKCTKLACHFKGNNQECLLGLRVSQYLFFLIKINGDINNCAFHALQ